jgi:hypothetical protein
MEQKEFIRRGSNTPKLAPTKSHGMAFQEYLPACPEDLYFRVGQPPALRLKIYPRMADQGSEVRMSDWPTVDSDSRSSRPRRREAASRFASADELTSGACEPDVLRTAWTELRLTRDFCTMDVFIIYGLLVAGTARFR